MGDGKIVPITIVKIDDNLKITWIKIKGVNDTYNSVQLTSGLKKIKNVSKPLIGHYNKAKVKPGKGLWEFRMEKEELENRKVGEIISINLFKKGEKINAKSISKGKGFSGVIKRHNFNSQRASHGNSLAHNAPGSIGQCQTPGRVFKGKKMAGRMGNTNISIKNLEIMNINTTENILLIKGAIPVFNGRTVILNHSKK